MRQDETVGQLLEGRAGTAWYPRDSIVFSTGAPSTDFYLVRSGAILILSEIDGLLGPPSQLAEESWCIGLLGVLNSVARRATAIATVPALVSVVTGDRLNELRHHAPGFARAIDSFVHASQRRPHLPDAFRIIDFTNPPDHAQAARMPMPPTQLDPADRPARVIPIKRKRDDPHDNTSR